MPRSSSYTKNIKNLTRESVRQLKSNQAWNLVQSYLESLRKLLDKEQNLESDQSYLLYRDWYYQLTSELKSLRLEHNHKIFEILHTFHQNCIYRKHSNRSLAYQQLSGCVYRHTSSY